MSSAFNLLNLSIWMLDIFIIFNFCIWHNPSLFWLLLKIFSSLVAADCFSKFAAVNVAAGAQTPLSSIVAALVMLVIVLGAAPLFAGVPLAVLAASIIIAALGMVDVNALRQAARDEAKRFAGR